MTRTEYHRAQAKNLERLFLAVEKFERGMIYRAMLLAVFEKCQKKRAVLMNRYGKAGD